jgi:hypothetical protein
MRHDQTLLPSTALPVLAVGFLLASCATGNFSGFGGGGEPPPPEAGPAVAALPSRYSPEEIVGRWGLASYHREADRARTEAQARGQCRNPYVITRGPSGGVMMHLADQRQASELQLKGGPGGKNYIGPEGEAGGPQDREILSFDGRVLITRYVDPDAGNRYGNMVYVRCGARA